MSSKKKELDTDQIASELTESAFFKPASTQTHKPTSPLVVKYTTHLLPSTIKAIKVFAAAYDLKDYEVMQAATSEFLERQKDSDLVMWLSRFALQEKMEVSLVITQALREYREKHK